MDAQRKLEIEAALDNLGIIRPMGAAMLTDVAEVVEVPADVAAAWPERPSSKPNRAPHHRRGIRKVAGIVATGIALTVVASAVQDDNPAASNAGVETTVDSVTTAPAAVIETSTSEQTATTEVAPTTTELIIAADATSYTVKDGDTLFRIAHAKKIDLPSLLAANPQIIDQNDIQSGQVIMFPVLVAEIPTTLLEAVPVVETAPIDTTEPPVTAPPETTPPETAPLPVPVDTQAPPPPNDKVLTKAECNALGGSIESLPAGAGTNAVYKARYDNPLGTARLSDSDMYHLFHDESITILDVFRNRQMFIEGECLPPQKAVAEALEKYYL